MLGIAIGVLLFSVAGLAQTEHIAPTVASTPAFLYTAAKRYEPLAWFAGGERFPAGATILLREANHQRILARDFAASADPALSFDGKRVLFAGRQKTEDHWQIWEISIEGGSPKRVTNCAQDCIRPFYLPDNRLVYSEKINGHFVIQSAFLDGGKPLALTYWAGNSMPTDVLLDGRVLFDSTYPPGESGNPEIYTVYSDGSGVESYRCDHGTPRHSGRQFRSGDIIFATEKGLARFTSARAKEMELPAPSGEYAGDVAESATGDWLLSWRANKNSPYELMWWRPDRKRLEKALHIEGANAIQPVLVSEHAVPHRHPSGLHDWPFANLLCLNAYTSKYKFAPGSVRSVRLYTKDANGVHLLGNAPVEADGSFFVQVSGDQPLQIELLDAAGKTLKREAGWFWLRRGEQRACVGCHVGPETAPENAVPMILLKSTTPADMTHPAAAAGGH
jgi:hypothetical protein